MFHIVVVLTIDKFVQHFQLSHSGIRLTSSDLKKKKSSVDTYRASKRRVVKFLFHQGQPRFWQKSLLKDLYQSQTVIIYDTCKLVF